MPSTTSGFGDLPADLALAIGGNAADLGNLLRARDV
jgi:hypothetical protein